MAPETKDEIFMVVALNPLLRMKLRARVDEEITLPMHPLRVQEAEQLAPSSGSQTLRSMIRPRASTAMEAWMKADTRVQRSAMRCYAA